MSPIKPFKAISSSSYLSSKKTSSFKKKLASKHDFINAWLANTKMRDVEVTSRDRKLRFHFLSVYTFEMETTIGIKRVEANARNSHDGLQQLVRRKLKVKLELGANQMQLTGLTTFYTTSSLLTIMFYAFYKNFILKYF